jgi:hypothetical protein
MDERAVANDRIEQRAAYAAAHVTRALVAENHDPLVALGDAELLAFNPRERLERGAGCSAAARAMTVGRVPELIRHGVMNGAAETRSRQQPTSINLRRVSVFRHALYGTTGAPSSADRLIPNVDVTVTDAKGDGVAAQQLYFSP